MQPDCEEFLAKSDGRSRRAGSRPIRFTFSLSSLFALTTLIGLQLGLLVSLPAVGVPVLIVTMPAYIWTARRTHEELAEGATVTRGDQLRWFVTNSLLTFGSMALTIVLIVAVPIALFALTVIAHYLPTVICLAIYAALMFSVALAIRHDWKNSSRRNRTSSS